MDDWKKLSEEQILKARVFRYRQVEYQSKKLDIHGKFDVLDCLDWINVIALTQKKEFLLVKQFRFGSEKITYEITGGAIDPGEEPVSYTHLTLPTICSV